MSLKCKIIKDFDFCLNKNMLNFVYQPIIGKQATTVYYDLIRYLDLQTQLGSNLHHNFNDLLSFLELDEKNFYQLLKLLEAMNLVTKYLEKYKQDQFIIKINPCLAWKQFLEEPKYFNLLINKIDAIELERIKNLFNNDAHFLGYVNISSTFEEVFGNNIKKFQLNFDFFYHYLLQKTGKLILLSEQNKVILDNAYTKYHYKYDQLVEFINQALVKHNLELKIDNQLLALAIKKKLDENQIEQFNLNLKINRNNQIFLENSDLEEFKYVIDDYRSLNAEHYLACIQRHDLDQNEINVINNLRKNYHLPDFIINILIDFSLFKNQGRIEVNYLNKIALTINRLNLNSVESVLKHLKHNKNVIKPSLQELKIDW